jgi:hypothetical protein
MIDIKSTLKIVLVYQFVPQRRYVYIRIEWKFFIQQRKQPPGDTIEKVDIAYILHGFLPHDASANPARLFLGMLRRFYSGH